MSDPLQALLYAGELNSSSVPARTAVIDGIAVATLEQPDSEPIAYLKRRFVPPPENFSVVQQHTVVQGDRVDNLAAHYLGDPELYWRIVRCQSALCAPPS